MKGNKTMYENIQTIPFEGAKSKNPYSFRYYDKNRVIAGKTMAEHLRFAMSWWHTCNASGTDMFGGNTMDKTFGLDGIAMHKAKVDFAFDLMQKLGIEFYCFHDVDIAPEGETLAESIKNLEIMTDYLLEKQNQTGIKPLWVTANMFGDKMFMVEAPFRVLSLYYNTPAPNTQRINGKFFCKSSARRPMGRRL